MLVGKARKARAERGRTWKQEANQEEFPTLTPCTALAAAVKPGMAATKS
jgi:hypothetical protein